MSIYNLTPGETYRITWNEHYYTGYSYGYFNERASWLVNVDSFDLVDGVNDLITSAGVTALTAPVTLDSGTPYRYPAETLAAASAGVVESITNYSWSQVENVSGDDGTDSWSTKETYRISADFKIKADATHGQYHLLWVERRYNAIRNQEYGKQDYNLTFNTTRAATVIIGPQPPIFPPERPDDYDEDASWDPDDQDWTGLASKGGGRYGKQLIAVSGQAKIYFGEL